MDRDEDTCFKNFQELTLLTINNIYSCLWENLTHLTCSSPEITDMHIVNLVNLESLFLSNSKKITDHGIITLINLISVNLWDCIKIFFNAKISNC